MGTYKDKDRQREWNREYMRSYRRRRAPAILAQDARVKEIRKGKLDYIRQHKTSTGCADCGEKDWVVLDLDHNDPLLKVCDPNKLQTYPWDRLKAELVKCIVRCANCHRRRSYRERHWEIRRH